MLGPLLRRAHGPGGLARRPPHPVWRPTPLPFWTVQERRLMANCGVIDPGNIDHYVARGGYEGLARALTMSPQEAIKEVVDSGLWGRGGAAFPAGRQWGV